MNPSKRHGLIISHWSGLEPLLAIIGGDMRRAWSANAGSDGLAVARSALKFPDALDV